MVKIT